MYPDIGLPTLSDTFSVVEKSTSSTKIKSNFFEDLEFLCDGMDEKTHSMMAGVR